jgi:hypothetical protein
MANFLVRKKEDIKDIIIPLFSKYKLLSCKEYSFKLFEQCFIIFLNSNLTQEEKIININKIKESKMPESYLSSF